MNNTLSSQDFSRQVRDMREANASVNPLDDEFSRDIGLEDQNSPRSVKTNTNVVILWDMLKEKFRPSEEDEIARLIGNQLIQKCEELRDEYNNFYEIYLEVQESENEAKLKLQEQFNKTSNIFSAGGNAKFLNQELSSFVELLQKKAVDSGLEQNSLIPKRDAKDRQIYEYIQENVLSTSRPQSAAMTGRSTQQSAMSNSFARKFDMDPTGIDATMRSSFYSSRNGGFNDAKGDVLDTFKVKNVLELSKDEMEKIAQIREFMQEQADGLRKEIDDLNDQLIQQQLEKSKPENQLSPPTQKDLKDYSTKLQDEYLKSDQTIKVQKAMTLPKEHKKFEGIKQDKLLDKLQSKPPLKIQRPSSKAKIVIPKQNIDTSITQESADSKIVRMTMKNAKPRPPSGQRIAKGGSVAQASPTMKKIKLKKQDSQTKQIDSSSGNKKSDELYGLDAAFIESLGLGDMLQDSPQKESTKGKSASEKKEDNMTIEELRQKYTIEGQHSMSNKLRASCKEYGKYYSQQQD